MRYNSRKSLGHAPETQRSSVAFCVFEELRCALFLACSLSLFFSRDSYAMHDRSVDAADAPGSRPSAASMMLGPATGA
ncbi:hypothetical protein CDV31_011355 [Fusarium ambrosium]|uniref:Uncharacterized protein n=1 Tax=Fusarium ambrosium TaxID=131363 RepID=A0A428THC3_9HYPO|nr:hypothetical protein CDV31_011355 [Fusarium ambrosium]